MTLEEIDKLINSMSPHISSQLAESAIHLANVNLAEKLNRVAHGSGAGGVQVREFEV